MNPPDLPLQVYLFNVGQGDHSLLRLPDGSYGIIDTFYDLRCNPKQEPPGLTYLRERYRLKEKIRIRFLQISHFDDDHTKGLDQWLDWIREKDIRLDFILLPGANSSAMLEKQILQAISDSTLIQSLMSSDSDIPDKAEFSSRINEYTAKDPGKALIALDNFTACLDRFSTKKKKPKKEQNKCVVKNLCAIHEVDLYYDPPPLNTYCIAPKPSILKKFAKQSPLETIKVCFGDKKRTGINKNDLSAALLLRYGQYSLTFGSDAGKSSLEESIEALTPAARNRIDGDFRSDFIKLFHHGADGSGSDTIWMEFLKEQQLVHIAVSSGTNERYAHPRREALDLIVATAKNPDKKSSLRFYGTHPKLLESRGGVKATRPAKKLRLWRNRVSAKKSGRRSRNERYLNLLPGAERVSRYNDTPGDGDLLGYRFEFGKDAKRVEVMEMVSG